MTFLVRLVARMERSEMRGGLTAMKEPGLRFAPSGLQACYEVKDPTKAEVEA